MRPLGFVQFDTTTAINADNIIVSTELASRFANDDYFNGWFVTIVVDADGSTAPQNGLGTTTRRVTDYVASSGTLTVAGPVLADEGSDQATCDLYRFHDADIERAFNRARQDVFPHIGIVRDVETQVTGPNQTLYTVPSTIRQIKRVEVGQRISAASVSENVLLNPGFETWTNSTTPENWTIAGGSNTVNEELQTASPLNYAVLEGERSARVHCVATGTLLQTLNPADSIAIENQEVHCSVWVYFIGNVDGTQPTVHPAIQGAGVRSAPVQGTIHTATGWERLTVSAFTQSDAALDSNVDVGLRFTFSSTAVDFFVDEAVCVIGPTEPYERPWAPLLDYDWIPPVAGASNGGLIRLREALPPKVRLRIVGVDLLSSVALDTDTIAVDGEYLEPLYNLTRAYLCEEQARESRGNETILWNRRFSEYANRYESGVNNGKALRMPNKRLMMPDKVW